MTNDDYLELIKEIDEGDFSVNTWEANFIDSLLNQMGKKKSFNEKLILSLKQRETLLNIKNKYIG